MVLDVLKEKKLEENTLVIFMGDNGEALLRGKGTLMMGDACSTHR